MLSPGYQVEPSPEVFGTSRVYFASPADLDKLRPLIFYAYEQQVKQLQGGA
jgi:hypothetical protein